MFTHKLNSAYPWLQEAVNNQFLDSFDFLFARTCIARISPSLIHNVHAEAFLAITSSLWRCGHPFLIIKESSLEPSIPGVSEEVLYHLFQNLPEAILEHIFVIQGKRLYLKKVFLIRESLFEKLKSLISATPKQMLTHISYDGLSDEQQQVCQQVVNSCFSIICGGPGTGKTFLAAFILKAFLKQYPNMRIAVVAPTGKAANHFTSVLSKDAMLSDRVSVQTIHKLLRHRESTQETIDLLLVDEGSMVSQDLLNQLVSLLTGVRQQGVTYADRMIILGDSNQLPPIGIAVGDPLQDLICSFPSVVHFLTTSHRAKNDHIRLLSKLILDKENIPFHSFLPRDRMIQLLQKKFITSLKESKQTLCVLTPMRKGFWGVDQLNRILYRKMQQEYPDLPVPIITTARCDVFNISTGEVGFLDSEKLELYFQGGEKVVCVNNFGFYTYNYVMSVHKSQGSEYDEVVVLIPRGSEVFETSVLYTAVTRAKQQVSIWADPETLNKITKKPHKYTYEAS